VSTKEIIKIKHLGEVLEKIVSFIQESANGFMRNGAVIGISGGIDSALSAYLTVRALGKENVLGLFMGERDSARQSEIDAELVARNLGIRLLKINITKILKDIGIYKLEPSTFLIPRNFQERYVLSKYNNLQSGQETTFLKSLMGGAGSEELKRGNAYFRAKHRVRMVMWYYYAELNNYIVIGCCNKTEKLTGYFIKYGDSGSDIDIISPLYKTQVRELAEFIGVPEQILQKAPSPDIMPGMTDEFALQMRYETLDLILYGLENGIDETSIASEANISNKEIDYVRKLIGLSKHMREMPPSPKINDLL
jgi:NAD+ synthase